MVPWYHGTCTHVHTRLLSTYVPLWYVRTQSVCSCVCTNGTKWYIMVHCTCTYVPWYVRTTYNVMSQLSDWKRAHMCTENHVCFGRIHGSQLREGANAGQHTPTLSLPPSHHCLDGEVYLGNRHYHGTRVRTYHGTMSASTREHVGWSHRI
jgi:hypothetical protein